MQIQHLQKTVFHGIRLIQYNEYILCFKYKEKNEIDYNAYNTLHEIQQKTKMYKIQCEAYNS